VQMFAEGSEDESVVAVQNENLFWFGKGAKYESDVAVCSRIRARICCYCLQKDQSENLLLLLVEVSE
jgi:hypothetical protein